MRGGLPGLSCVALAEPGRLRPTSFPHGHGQTLPRIVISKNLRDYGGTISEPTQGTGLDFPGVIHRAPQAGGVTPLAKVTRNRVGRDLRARRLRAATPPASAR